LYPLRCGGIVRRMRNRLLPIATFLGLLLSVACGKTVTPTGPDAATSPDVSGVVVSPLGFPVQAATVVATNGPLAGKSTTTDEGGRFLLAGGQSSSGLTVRVTKAGFQDSTWVAVTASQPASNLRIVLWPSVRTDAGLHYTIVLTADPACSGLPEDVRTRRYKAALQVDQSAPNALFTLPLEGADFYPTQRVIWGVGGASDPPLKVHILSWEVAERWLDDGPIVEALGGSRYLAVSGTAVMTLGAPVQSLTSTFEGVFSYCASGGSNTVFFECAVPPVECRSSSHQMTLAPQ
jgi:hypothetical protein